MLREGYNQSTLARAVGLTQGALNQILSGQTRRSRYLPELARVLSTSVDYLLGEADSPEPPADQPGYLPTIGGLTEAMARSLNLLRVSYLPSAYVSAFAAEPAVRYLPADIVSIDTEVAPDWAMLTVDDNSMAPTLATGDSVLVNRNERAFVVDGIYVLRASGRIMLRRLIAAASADSVLVKADDPLYPTETMARAAIDIYGRARWAGRRLA